MVLGDNVLNNCELKYPCKLRNKLKLATLRCCQEYLLNGQLLRSLWQEHSCRLDCSPILSLVRTELPSILARAVNDQSTGQTDTIMTLC